jgi:hypothetical protein
MVLPPNALGHWLHLLLAALIFIAVGGWRVISGQPLVYRVQRWLVFAAALLLAAEWLAL